MDAELWTVVGALTLPYLPYLLVAGWKNRRSLYDPANPRESDAALEGWARRARTAEQNSWEALASYVAVAFVADRAGVDRALLAALGGAWIVSRLAYVGAYVAGFGRARIVTWFVGLALLLARLGTAIVA